MEIKKKLKRERGNGNFVIEYGWGLFMWRYTLEGKIGFQDFDGWCVCVCGVGARGRFG